LISQSIFGSYLSTEKDEGLLLRLSGSRSFQCLNRQVNEDFSGTEARRLEGAGPIYNAKELTVRVPLYWHPNGG
jgi:hypothetical protein